MEASESRQQAILYGQLQALSISSLGGSWCSGPPANGLKLAGGKPVQFTLKAKITCLAKKKGA
jgi:hypothetical protein